MAPFSGLLCRWELQLHVLGEPGLVVELVAGNARVEDADEFAGQVTEGTFGRLPAGGAVNRWEWARNGVHGVRGLTSPSVHNRSTRLLCRLPEVASRSRWTLVPDFSSSTDQPRCRRSALSDWNAPTGAPIAPRTVVARISFTAGNEQITRACGARATVVAMRSSMLATSSASRLSCPTR